LKPSPPQNLNLTRPGEKKVRIAEVKFWRRNYVASVS